MLDSIGEMSIQELRSCYPVLSKVVYLNTGSVGLCPNEVVRKTLRAVGYLEREGLNAYERIDSRMEMVRAKVASLLGAQAEEIAFTGNATDGVNIVAWGLDWPDDAEVLISDQEHPAMLYPWHHLQSFGGPRVKMFRVDPDPTVTLSNVRSCLTARTALIACSHVSCQTGIRLPVREICRLAVERGILCFLDGAQAVGQFPVNVNELGCDFYTTNGHKWLGGPKGTGMLYIRRDRLDMVKPRYVGGSKGIGWLPQGRLEFKPSALRYEYGTRGVAVYAGLGAALDWNRRLGWAACERRMRELSCYLKDRLSDLPGVKLLTPREWPLSSAMTSFVVAGRDPQELYDHFWQRYKLLVRKVDELGAIRVSNAYYNTVEELDLLLRGTEEVLQMKGRAC
ncbi:MAG: aminotransferase class V-fold PLP-dependent enzyme [Chloroflexota bacterium]